MNILDPCCKSGNLLKPLKDKGHNVLGICRSKIDAAYSSYNLNGNWDWTKFNNIRIADYENDFDSVVNLLKSLQEKGLEMKFDAIIGNPPWNTKNDIHANIAKKCLSLCDSKIILLMPYTFMETNSNGRHERYRDSLGKSLTFIEIQKNISKSFGIGFDNAAIFEFINNKGTVDYDILMEKSNALIEDRNALIEDRNALIEDLFKTEWVNHQTIKSMLKTFDENKKGKYINVATFIGKLTGHFDIIINGKNEKGDEWRPTENSWDKGIYSKDAENIVNSWSLDIMKDLNYALTAGNNTGRNALAELRMMNDYSKPITEKQFITEMGIEKLVSRIKNLAKEGKEFRSRGTDKK